MHPTALYNCQNFFETYFPSTDEISPKTVVEIGAQNVNGGLREKIPNTFEYLGSILSKRLVLMWCSKIRTGFRLMTRATMW